jgi:hypothetical protein
MNADGRGTGAGDMLLPYRPPARNDRWGVGAEVPTRRQCLPYLLRVLPREVQDAGDDEGPVAAHVEAAQVIFREQGLKPRRDRLLRGGRPGQAQAWRVCVQPAAAWRRARQ